MKKPLRNKKSPQTAQKLLAWYDAHARQMPWRIGPPIKRVMKETAELENRKTIDPYHVFLSEIMLQQTQVATVVDYFNRFITRWPDIKSLAKAPLDDVLSEWAGLGYYSRARNLKKAAEQIIAQYDGNFPKDYNALIKLPGIGDYTASAISAIAFQQPLCVVDGNVERIVTRLAMIKTPIPKAKPEIKQFLDILLQKPEINQRPGDFAQSFMDLGATLCTAKKPKCEICPISAHCQAYLQNCMLDFPKKLPKKQKPTRKGACFIVQNNKGAIWLEKRPETGMLAQMSALPSSDWGVNQDGANLEAAPFMAKWQKLGIVKHTFTHFHLKLDVFYVQYEEAMERDGWWSNPNQLPSEAIPTLFRKAIKLL